VSGRVAGADYLTSSEGAPRALLLTTTTARLVMQSAERLQTATTDAGRRVREALADTIGVRESARR
jgi:hypothetical protein